MLLKASFQSTLTEWFSMSAVAPSVESAADLVVIMESGLDWSKSVEGSFAL